MVVVYDVDGGYYLCVGCCDGYGCLLEGVVW